MQGTIASDQGRQKHDALGQPKSNIRSPKHEDHADAHIRRIEWNIGGVGAFSYEGTSPDFAVPEGFLVALQTKAASVHSPFWFSVENFRSSVRLVFSQLHMVVA
jgi:hypothetical protein